MRGRTSVPSAAYREDRRLFLVTVAAAATSIAALLLHLAGAIRMPYTLTFVTLPGTIFLMALLILARRVNRPVTIRRLQVGAIAGVLGLVAYNATRWVVAELLALPNSPFYSIYIFGSLITAQAPDTTAAIVAGWLYHVSNGITFAIMYTLVAGPARWWFGLLWGLALETAMLVVYPSSAILRPPALASFVVVSLISHAVYGAVIGLVSQRYARLRSAP
ncbi:hypothetical protein SAMN05661093_00287 [Kibdelosporangium aridum]|uniref:Uncharacterized protein n=2 Tax=Kibdelosporangium aridum TaxID=2030 RepID=A0A1Y5WU32_KIBAR|nr:hypothetical protein SAMN05661093_00287 [Kibdelosporangium aridum]